jgi:alkanesulfonate monooxygenase SsuD/methylene tetrahydromethanopterin reductase-like flavin-dependent oxidoreductase (luciferase family)
MAAAVDVLSGGRVILGIGAGWNENEHREFHIPFPTQRERFDVLDAAIPVMRETWNRSNPKPVRNPMPLLMGGTGEKRTLPMVARDASEWNLSRLDRDMYVQRRDFLEACCREIGRDPSSIRHSVMTNFIIGRSESEIRERAEQLRRMSPDLSKMSLDEMLENRRSAWFIGTPEQIAEKIRELARIGIDLFMLRQFLLDDRDALKLLAEVIPAVA